MNKQEINQYLTNCKGTLQEFLNVCTTDEELNQIVDLAKAIANIDVINIWIDEVLEDIKANLIPESFYEKLKHDIERNIPSKYYTSFGPNESKIASYKHISENLSGIDNLMEIYSFYKALGFAQQNAVLVGANGCGKTSLANLLQQTLNVSDGIVIPAQKLLIIPTFANTPNYSSAHSHFTKYQKTIFSDKVTFDAKEMDEVDWTLTKTMGSEMVKVMGMLLAQRQLAINKASTRYKEGEKVSVEDFRGILDEIIDIWNHLIEHRELFCNDNNQLQIKFGTTFYDAHQMSDGERVIIYLAGRVLLAPKGGIIIADEPELHLHKSIANKLWDILENKRQDCKFIYFTHDLDFATSRKCQKGWIRAFKYPNSWQVELISENEIPEELLLKLIGSRKPILFCEGKQGSIDRHLFEILYPQYTIQAVDSCKNVINYTRAFNRVTTAYRKAIGIIDRDFRTNAQIESLSNDNIYSYDVAEIENLFLAEDFINEYSIFKHETSNTQEIKEKVMAAFSHQIESQISFYLTAYINYKFAENHIKQANTLDLVKANYIDFTSTIDIDQMYAERQDTLHAIIDQGDYTKLIKVANDKGLLKVVAQSFGLKGRNEYISRALHVLEHNTKAQDILRRYFPAVL